METIRVNMTPCEDIKTIHASQNDNEGREWGFELHNNGDKIDSSSISDQLVFKAYEGGTEEILPTNGSTPTTSPFKGDIRYPQGLLTDQGFTYRQSPSEEDGFAKPKSIKGNTLVWNQLVQNGNFADTSNWTMGGLASLTVGSNVGTVKATGTSDQFSIYPSNLSILSGHKYFITFEVKLFGSVKVSRNKVDGTGNTGRIYSGKYSTIETSATDRNIGQYSLIYAEPVTDVINDYYTIKNVMLIDLTQMGLDISNPSDFTSLFPLPYYAYNQGTLLSFNGNGIKTVGKNLFDFSQFANGTITFENGDLKGTAGQFSASYSNVVSNGIELKYPENTQITISFDARTEQNDAPSGNGIYLMASENGTSTRIARATNETTSIQHITATIPSNRHIDKLGWTYGANALNIWHITNFQVEFGTETEYEPYTSSTLSLPISTYFPSGMDGVGTDYDELTNTKATTRMTRVDLGSLDWNYNPTYGMYSTGIINSVKKPSASSVRANAISTIGTFTDWATFYASGTTSGLLAINTSGYIGIATTETNSTTFKNSLQGVYLVYPLATPTEVTFSTASLVTENAEIPLSNEDGTLIGKCTEQLSENPGFFDAKIKLADEDGECYSNKIQLHIERKPS